MPPELSVLFDCHDAKKIFRQAADSQLPHRSAFSAVDCNNSEIENFLSLCGNAPVHCRICTSVNESLGTALSLNIATKNIFI